VTTTAHRWFPLIAFFALLASRILKLWAQEACYLTDQEIESSEAKTTLNALVRENVELEHKLQQAEMSAAALQNNLALATAEVELFKRQVSELQIRLEALGLESAGEPGRLEQRLLQAANDLRLSEQERVAVREALLALHSAALRFRHASATEDLAARKSLDTALNAANFALEAVKNIDEAPPVSATLNDGLVISVKRELALVVANLGRRHGVKIGMPFRVLRGETKIGTIRIVDVREKISGAVVQDLWSDTTQIQVGDRLKVEAEQ
jgi:hypothetical protein